MLINAVLTTNGGKFASMHGKTLIVITGPTAAGKTAAAIAVARRWGCHIVCADSRQIYRGIPVCTAAPTPAERAAAPHHLVEFLNLDQPYSASQYESDVMALLPQLWRQSDYAVLCGGSMLYVDAVCRGIDPMPDISPEVRQAVIADRGRMGLDGLLEELRRLDPAYFAQVDTRNPRRVMHAVEVCRQTGLPYSTLRTGRAKPRDFAIVRVALSLPRKQLFDRINRRVLAMVDNGLEQEARSVMHLRHLNSLNTVGMKEMFSYLDGTWDLPTAIARIQKNTRVYAKKQLTWLKRDTALSWCAPSRALATVAQLLSQKNNSEG